MSIKPVPLHAASEILKLDDSAADRALGPAGIFDSRLEALFFKLNVTTPKGAYRREIATDKLVRVRNRYGDVGVAVNALRNAAQGQRVEATVITDCSCMHSTPDIAAGHARLADFAVTGVWVRSLEVPQVRARRGDSDRFDRPALPMLISH